jgi:hypothetical protein
LVQQAVVVVLVQQQRQEQVEEEEEEVALRLVEEREFCFSLEFFLYSLVILVHPVDQIKSIEMF